MSTRITLQMTTRDVVMALAFVVTCLFGAALASELAMWVRW